jgi:predicted component of type VI protein secretion system
VKKETILKKIKQLERNLKILPSFTNFSNHKDVDRIKREIEKKIETYKGRLK